MAAYIQQMEVQISHVEEAKRFPIQQANAMKMI